MEVEVYFVRGLYCEIITKVQNVKADDCSTMEFQRPPRVWTEKGYSFEFYFLTMHRPSSSGAVMKQQNVQQLRPSTAL